MTETSGGNLPVACLALASIAAFAMIDQWNTCHGQSASTERVVIPFDFESQFDDGRYGRMVGEMVWKKLDRDGGFIIPESMLDVRDWQQRERVVPSPDTPLEQMARYVKDGFGADIAIWGKVERVAGHEWDVYDLWIKVYDFSGDSPKAIFDRKVRTKTVSEIPHVYVKSALDELYGRQEQPMAGPDPEQERRWREGPNLVKGDFERGTDHPEGWDPLPEYVSWVNASSSPGQSNRVIRFQFPKSVAASTGVLYYSEYFPIQENALYRFQCRWRSTGSQVKVFIKCYDDLPTRFQSRPNEDRRGADASPGRELREVYRSQQNLKGSAMTWNVHTEDFTPRHTQYTPRQARVMLYAYWPAGTVDFDDVVIKMIAPPPTDQPPKVRRPSLETKVLSEELEKVRNRP